MKIAVTVVGITGILLIILGLYDHKAEMAIAALKDRYAQIEKTRTDIIHYNDILTMSVRMAAATSDLKWLNRYRAYEPQLSKAIERAIVLSPEIYRQEIDRNNISKTRLLAMEHQALNLVQAGKSKEAVSIVFGDSYEELSRIYVQAVERLNQFLSKQMDAALEVEKSKANLARTALISVLIMLLLSWLVILRISRAYQDALLKSNAQLLKRSGELDELNKTLDQKVQERTSSLAQALEQLTKTNKNLQETQTQLVQSEKFSAIGQLAAGMAHEINNPIGFINNNIQTMQKYALRYANAVAMLNDAEESFLDNDLKKTGAILTSWQDVKNAVDFNFMNKDVQDLLQESREGIEKIKKIVFNLRAFSGPDRGAIGSINLEVLMDSMLNLVWNEIKYKAELRRQYSDVEAVVCNPQEISQVFVNLMLNAAQAIKEKGSITIKTYAKGNFVCFDVVDTGCGISPEVASKIFDPFFTTKINGKAMGLGLSISYDIVRKHGGSISYKTKIGEGTTFTVMLPQNCMKEADADTKEPV